MARWLLLLGMVDDRNGKVYDEIFKELEAIAMKDQTLQDAFENWEELSLTREQRLAYESRLKKVLDEESAVREAELRVQKGREEGMEKGIAKGKQVAEEAIARRLLAEGMDIETIAKVTGLEKDRVIELQ